MFLNPLMLAGVGGAAVPVVLHLLSRARYRTVDWGAMMFLTGVDARQRRSTRLKQWSLLLVRSLIVAALALALARPAISSHNANLGGNGTATAVIILDDSASMACVENGRSRLDLARQAALQILSAMNRGDQVAFIPTGTPLAPADRAPTSDLQSVAARIAAVRPGFGQADFVNSLSRAADVLERYERVNREIYIITDRQAISWRRVASDPFRRAWHARFPGGPAPRTTVITVGGDTANNLVVESLDVLNPPIIKDQPTDLEIHVRNIGAQPHSNIPMTVSVGGRAVAELPVTLAPDSTAVLHATIRAPESGSRLITAALKAGGLTADNRLDRAVDVYAPLKVLIVGDEDADPGKTQPSRWSAASLIRLALTPNASSGAPGGADPAIVKVVVPSKFAAADLDGVDVVILANIDRFGSSQARDLEQFVFSGGGMLIAPGNVSRVDEYNNVLFRFGAGILPASLSPPTPLATTGTLLVDVDLTHPIFGFLNGHTDILGTAAVLRYFPATPRTADVRVLGSYASGYPFLIEGAAGRGRVLLVTTSLDADWTTLPQTSFYLPFLQSAVRYLAGNGPNNRNLAPSQPIIASIAEPVEEHSANLRLPNGETEQLPVLRLEDRTEIRFNRTDEPGVYRLRYRSEGKERLLHYVIVSPRAESDLTPMNDAQWAAVTDAVGLQHIDAGETPVVSTVARDRAGRELWMPVMAGVIVLAAAEMLLARRWSSEP
ncbi:MAG TPA: BatA domain-containing protein [Tepidisphaeraceae bacterium]|nr:BatA domain-containing protein [Tepidisphaeraceae bacterium]